MTERGRGALDRSATHLGVGPSTWTWIGGRVTIDIDEWTAPLPGRLRGRIDIDPGPVFETFWALDEAGRHLWRPIAPCAAVEVAFERPALRWRGRGYLDMNAGDEPLEAGFHRWHWSREDHGAGTRVLYHVVPRQGGARGIALNYGAGGGCAPCDAGTPVEMSPTRWRVPRSTHAQAGRPVRLARTLEDTPFYARTMLAVGGDGTTRMHETVDLDRFRSRWVQALLPFRMPRRAG